MFYKIKNYINNLNRRDVIIGAVLLFTFILAYTGKAGLTPVATGAFFIFGGIFLYKMFDNLSLGKSLFLDKRLLIPFCLIILSIVASFFWLNNYYLAARFLAAFIIFGVMIFGAKRINPGVVVLFLAAISALNLGLAFWDIFNYFDGGAIRLTGFVGYTNTLGLYSTVFGLIALSYLNKVNVKLKWFLIIISAINFFIAIMTLSRGVGVAILLSGFLTTLFFYKKIEFKKVFKYGFISIIIALLLTGSVYLVKKYVVSQQLSFSRNDISVIETSGLRLKYFTTAFEMFKQNNFGVGPGNYREAMFKYLKNPIEQANDPHSFPMMLLAENGLFIIFWLYLFFEIIRNVFINKEKLDQTRILYIFTGMVFFFHSLADGDMAYPFSWIIFGFLIGNTLFLQQTQFKFYMIAKNITAMLLLVFGFLNLTSSFLLINNLDFVGNYDELNKRDKGVLLAAKISPINASTWDSAATMSLYKMVTAENETDKQKSAKDLFYRTSRSMALKGQYASQYSLRARAYSILRDEANYRTSLERSVELSSFNTHSERRALSYYYRDHSLYPELKNLALSTYALNQDYFGTAYSASDSELQVKTGEMISMLQILPVESKKYKDPQTEQEVISILSTIK